MIMLVKNIYTYFASFLPITRLSKPVYLSLAKHRERMLIFMFGTFVSSFPTAVSVAPVVITSSIKSTCWLFSLAFVRSSKAFSTFLVRCHKSFCV